jgi:hypothetical protein
MLEGRFQKGSCAEMLSKILLLIATSKNLVHYLSRLVDLLLTLALNQTLGHKKAPPLARPSFKKIIVSGQ